MAAWWEAAWQDLPQLALHYGPAGLVLTAFAEASFFPLPPDALLIPLALLNPAQAILLGAATTVASSLGGVFGWYLGLRAGRPLLDRFVSASTVAAAEDLFARYGGWAVLIAGLTPIPYKVFTIASGVFGISARTVFVASLAGRGARFMGEAVLLAYVGERAVSWLGRYSGPATLALAALLVAGYVLCQRLGKARAGRRP